VPYPTPDEFRALLRGESLETLVRTQIFGGVPYAFREDLGSLTTLNEHLAGQLELTHDQIAVVGSGRTGFCVTADGYGRAFSDDSDLDVIVVSASLFDSVWYTVTGWHYPRRYRLAGKDRRWDARRRDDLYWGWFRPDAIRYDGLSLPEALLPLRDLSARWFEAFQSLSQYDTFATRRIEGRLYRTWEHAFLYHLASLRKLRAALEPNGEPNGLQ
jgi:hypothetical protein